MYTQKVAIIGGGIAGCSAALALANLKDEQGNYLYEVVLLESNNELCSGSSDASLWRAGLGFHYDDEKTAKKQLRNTVRFARTFQDECQGNLFIAEKEELSHSLRRSRYFILRGKNKNSASPQGSPRKESSLVYKNKLSNSDSSEESLSLSSSTESLELIEIDNLQVGNKRERPEDIADETNFPPQKIQKTEEIFNLFSPREILNRYEELRQEYVRLIAEDPRNKVFGSPEDFWVELPISVYQGDVNTELISMGLETAEQTLNWPYFKKYYTDLVQDQEKHPNLTVVKECKVEKFATDFNKEHRYTVVSNKGILEADYIINSAWHNIEAINEASAIYNENNQPIIGKQRAKVSVEIELPRGFVSKNSMLFCFGAHCGLTNQGNGKALITYEPVTNIAESKGFKLPDDILELVEKNKLEDLNRTQRAYLDKLGQNILDGVRKYITGLETARVLKVKCGVVKTEGENAAINTADSNIHKRDRLCVKTEKIGLISNPCMKLTYFLANADIVSELIQQHRLVGEEVENLMQSTNFALLNDQEIWTLKEELLNTFAAYPDPKNDSIVINPLMDENNVSCFKAKAKQIIEQHVARKINLIVKEAERVARLDFDDDEPVKRFSFSNGSFVMFSRNEPPRSPSPEIGPMSKELSKSANLLGKGIFSSEGSAVNLEINFKSLSHP